MNSVVWIIYRLVKYVVWIPIHLRYKFDVKGRQNLPKGGGYILTSNHLGMADTLVLPVYLRSQVSFATKEELYRFPLDVVLILTGMTRIRRTDASYGELKKFRKQAESVLEKGLVFGIFPEGTRSKTGRLLPFEPGTGFLASTTGRSIVPIGLSYSEGTIWTLNRTVAHISIGVPIETAGRRKEDITFEVRQRTAELSGQELAREDDTSKKTKRIF